MSRESQVMTRPNDGRARAVIFLSATDAQRRIYFRRDGSRPEHQRGSAMIPNPSERPMMTAEEAFAELGINRDTGYRAIRDGTFPVTIIRVGRLIRVPTMALRRVLQLDDTNPDDSESPTEQDGGP